MPEHRLIHPVILSGGAGTRLWPLSRGRSYPKQFIPLLGEESLLRQTLDRVSNRSRFAKPLILSGGEHRFLVGEVLRRANLEAEAVVLEPEPRNTGPAACIAALMLAASAPSALMFLLPSDHHIANHARFLRSLELAAGAALDGWTVTFGIAPDRGETDYGYIRHGAVLAGHGGCHKVARFVEKPDRETAEAYLASGKYLWNSGMVLVTAARLVEEFERLQPAIVQACRAALAGARTDGDFLRLEPKAFAAAPSISLDHAVMERTASAVVVPVDIGWTDVGSWEALWRAGHPDAEGNVTVGDVRALDSRNNYLHSDDRLLAALGIEDLVVVATRDAVLVRPRGQMPQIGHLMAGLQAEGRHDAGAHGRIYQHWGCYERIDAGDGFQVRRLVVNPMADLPLRQHHGSSVHWIVVSGRATASRDGATLVLEAGRSASIPPGVTHGLANRENEPLRVVEVRTGQRPDEDDAEPLETPADREPDPANSDL